MSAGEFKRMIEGKILQKPSDPHSAAREIGKLVESWFGREAGGIIAETLSNIIDDSSDFDDPHEWWGKVGDDPG